MDDEPFGGPDVERDVGWSDSISKIERTERSMLLSYGQFLLSRKLICGMSVSDIECIGVETSLWIRVARRMRHA